jgi:lipopolysaccharide export system protein LptA
MKADIRSRHPLNLLRILLILLLAPAAAPALESDKDQPVYIEADSVEIDDRTGVRTYQGNVVMTQGSIHMTADKVTVTKTPKGSDHVLAVGKPVTFQQQREGEDELARGRALRAEYDLDSDIIKLYDDAELSQGKDTLRNDRITYDKSKELMWAGTSQQGKQRVRITLQPNSSEKDKK